MRASERVSERGDTERLSECGAKHASERVSE
jgi:hypothetical protein